MIEITATAFFIYSPIVFDCLWKTVKAGTGARILNLCELGRVLGVKTIFTIEGSSPSKMDDLLGLNRL